MTGLAIRREDGESWREAAARIGRQRGLEHEVLETFDEEMAGAEIPHSEDIEAQAAWDACYEWDVCDLVQGGENEPTI